MKPGGREIFWPPVLRRSAQSYGFPPSMLPKYLGSALCANFTDYVGTKGANAVTDLYIPGFLIAQIKAPFPPILNPVTDLRAGSHGKYFSTISGNSFVT